MSVDVLIPTCDRPAALAVTLAGLAGQVTPLPPSPGQARPDAADPVRVTVADQSLTAPVASDAVVAAAVRVLEYLGRPVRILRNLPRRGLAQQRQFLLEAATAERVLFLDDDVWLAPGAVATMCAALDRLGCGFVGMAVQGLTHLHDLRPGEQAAYEEWHGPVQPEVVRPGTPAWERHRLHNAANLLHMQQRLGLAAGEWRAYRIAWVGGCVLYDRQALLSCGGFDFWRDLPPQHCGEDVAAQLRVMERFGGAGLLPTLAFHQQLPTTVTDRRLEAYDVTLARDRPPSVRA